MAVIFRVLIATSFLNVLCSANPYKSDKQSDAEYETPANVQARASDYLNTPLETLDRTAELELEGVPDEVKRSNEGAEGGDAAQLLESLRSDVKTKDSSLSKKNSDVQFRNTRSILSDVEGYGTQGCGAGREYIATGCKNVHVDTTTENSDRDYDSPLLPSFHIRNTKLVTAPRRTSLKFQPSQNK